MHFTEYWSIVERNHTIQNPSTPEKMALLADYCGLQENQRVLDVGSGKGWLLCEWAKRFRIRGTGLEINPWFVADARERVAHEGMGNRVTFIEAPALDYALERGSWDVVLCIGASFALGGFDGALTWMQQAMKPHGVLAIGEPFLNETPAPEEMIAAFGEWGLGLRDLRGTVALLEAHGLELVGMIAASQDDWDRYESPHWPAAREWIEKNPSHPDRDEFVRQVNQARDSYLRWERRYLGWAIFVARPALKRG